MTGSEAAGAPTRLEYSAADLRRLAEIPGGPLSKPSDLRRVIDQYPYLDDWRSNYRIQSVRSSLHSPRITCVDGAILAYGLLELLFPDTKRRLLAIHRRDPATDEEAGHCVALYWGRDGRIGALSKSSFKGLGHRDAVFPDEVAIATSYARAYIDMGFQPLYFGVTTLEAIAPDLDWRFARGDLNPLADRLKASYEYSLTLAD